MPSYKHSKGATNNNAAWKKDSLHTMSSAHLEPNSENRTQGELNPSGSVGVDADALADMRTFSNLQEKRKRKKRKKAIVVTVACVLALVAIVGGIWWFAGSMTEEPLEQGFTETTFVEKGMFLDEVSASGKLTPVSSVSATPEVDGLVGEVLVSEGDTVTAGQTLYTVVNGDLDKAVAQAQQGIDEANNGIKTAQLAVDDAYRVKRVGQEAAAEAPTATVDEDGKEVVVPPTPFDVDAADSAIRQAELTLSSAYSARDVAQAAYDDAVALTAKRTITSPIDGSVVKVDIEPGKSLGAAGAAVSSPVQIADLSRMLVSVEVNEVDILKVTTEQTALLTFSAIPDLALEGVVNRIATVNTGMDDGMGMGTVTYAVDILIEAPDPRLKPGMTAKASIETQKLENVLMVPLSAVMTFSATEGSVYVVNPDDPENPQERTVEILASNGLTMAVKGDLSENDEIMLVGGGGMLDYGMEESEAFSSGAVTETMVG